MARKLAKHALMRRIMDLQTEAHLMNLPAVEAALKKAVDVLVVEWTRADKRQKERVI